MKIHEIHTIYGSNINPLIDLLHQQMIDIGSKKSKETIYRSVENALKNESRARFFILADNDKPIGMVFINVCSGIESEGDYVWLNEIQIVPTHRGKGLGKRLLEHIIQWANLKGYKCILSIASIQNTVSQNLFQSKGFELSNVKWMEREM